MVLRALGLAAVDQYCCYAAGLTPTRFFAAYDHCLIHLADHGGGVHGCDSSTLLKNKAVLADADDVSIMELGSFDRLRVHDCAVRALEVFQKIDGLYLNDFGVVAGNGVVVNHKVVVRLSSNGEVILREIHRAGTLAVKFDDQLDGVGGGLCHDAHS